MKYLTILQIAICYLIANQDLIGQNCKLAKDELDPFTKKQVVLTKTFNMANPITSEARKPTLHGQFGLENDSIYFKLQSIIIVSDYCFNAIHQFLNKKEYIDILRHFW